MGHALSPRLCREIPLYYLERPTLKVDRVGWFLTRPGCHTACVEFEAEPQGLDGLRRGNLGGVRTLK